MEAEAMMRIVKRWEDDQKVTLLVTGQDSKMPKVIRKSRWNVRHEYDANHAKKALGCYCQELLKKERQLVYGRSRNWFYQAVH
jgi:hypothetical protein